MSDSQVIDIYEACLGGKIYAWALTFVDAKATVESSARFGDPSEDEYALCDHWAEPGSDDGWAIQKRLVNVRRVQGEKTGVQNEGGHIVWQCPQCNRWSDQDWLAGDTSPYLVACSRRGCELGYFLVDW